MLDLPDGFNQSAQCQNPAFDFIEFRDRKSATMKIGYWSWNKPGSELPDEVAFSFKNILAKPPHDLIDEEIDEIAQVIPGGVYGHGGEIDNVRLRTERVGGRNVLVMINSWDGKDINAYGIFVPSNKDHKFCEHIHF